MTNRILTANGHAHPAIRDAGAGGSPRPGRRSRPRLRWSALRHQRRLRHLPREVTARPAPPAARPASEGTSAGFPALASDIEFPSDTAHHAHTTVCTARPAAWRPSPAGSGSTRQPSRSIHCFVLHARSMTGFRAVSPATGGTCCHHDSLHELGRPDRPGVGRRLGDQRRPSVHLGRREGQHRGADVVGGHPALALAAHRHLGCGEEGPDHLLDAQLPRLPAGGSPIRRSSPAPAGTTGLARPGRRPPPRPPRASDPRVLTTEWKPRGRRGRSDPRRRPRRRTRRAIRRWSGGRDRS